MGMEISPMDIEYYESMESEWKKFKLLIVLISEDVEEGRVLDGKEALLNSIVGWNMSLN